jgi:hypothetical protein
LTRTKNIDVLESILRKQGNLLDILLIDRTTSKNILWATDSYLIQQNNTAFDLKKPIKAELVTGYLYDTLIQPRAVKSLVEQKRRTKEKAEVFTPLETIGKMNRQIDKAAGFGRISEDNWKEYVKQLRLEITCGEAPFIAGRYTPEAHTGRKIELYTNSKNSERPLRVGFLDQKLYAVTKYCEKHKDWVYWAKEAFKASYGYEWQGDNVLIARENLLYTFIDFYEHKFGKDPSLKLKTELAEIISWNIFQMDGLKYVVPMSCKPKSEKYIQQVFFDELEPKIEEEQQCEGCLNNDPFTHSPKNKYVKIMDWEKGKPIKFVDLLKDIL